MDNANNDNARSNAATAYRGSCHCGAIRFELWADLGGGATRCNCTICTKIGARGIIVAPEALRSLTPEGELSFYEWGGKVARRYFCKVCGIHTFSRGYLAELGGAFASVNLNTLDDIDPALLRIGHWDGRHDNWQAGLRDAPWPIFAEAA
jgi:hypothetical protein